ncbi:hypothetical protein J132_10018 [Termitomyces sp. J132]|nr:hypothetical protein J132_10018 [Termitomyces sp. J132]
MTHFFVPFSGGNRFQCQQCLRQLFCTILFHCAPTTPEALWDKFKHFICNDLQCRLENI